MSNARQREWPMLPELRKLAHEISCDVITQEALTDLVYGRADAIREARQLRAEVARLREALKHEPWWRRRRA